LLLCIFNENLNSFQQVLFELIIFKSSNWTAGRSSAVRVTSSVLSWLGSVLSKLVYETQKLVHSCLQPNFTQMFLWQCILPENLS